MGNSQEQRTEQQLQALRDVFKLLEDNFDDVLLVCGMRSDHQVHGGDPDVYWKGGFLMARTLADHAKDKLNYRRVQSCKPK